MSFEAERAAWAKRQANRSQRPLEYWTSLADRLWSERIQFGNNPNVPIYWWYRGLSTDFQPRPQSLHLFEGRSLLKAMDLEKQGRLEDAMLIYEIHLAEEFTGSTPSDRLRILYTKQKNYVDAIRVCQTYLTTLDHLEKTWPGYPNLQQRPKLREQIAKLQAKLDKPSSAAKMY